jgi:hypothetical protein
MIITLIIWSIVAAPLPPTFSRLARALKLPAVHDVSRRVTGASAARLNLISKYDKAIFDSKLQIATITKQLQAASPDARSAINANLLAAEARLSQQQQRLTEIYAAIDRSNRGQTLPESIVNTARRAIDNLGKTTLGQALVLTGVGLAGAKVGESLNRPKLSRTPSEGLSPASNVSESQAPHAVSQTANTRPRLVWSRRGKKNWSFYPSKVQEGHSNASESSASQAPPVMSQTANTGPRNIWSRRGTKKNWNFYPSKV